MQLIHDALQIDLFCNESQTILYPTREDVFTPIPTQDVSHAIWFVDPKKGSDEFDASEKAPLKTIKAAIEASRKSSAPRKTILLKKELTISIKHSSWLTRIVV